MELEAEHRKLTGLCLEHEACWTALAQYRFFFQRATGRLCSAANLPREMPDGTKDFGQDKNERPIPLN
jgi:hypothetical protein